jgi:hypothetical protein
MKSRSLGDQYALETTEETDIIVTATIEMTKNIVP